MSRSIAALLLVFCTLLWGLAFVGQKTALDHMGPVTFVGMRYGLARASALLPFAIRGMAARTAQPHARPVGPHRILNIAFFIGQVAAAGGPADRNRHEWRLHHRALRAVRAAAVTFIAIRVRPHPIIYVGAPLALVGIYLLTGARFDSFTAGDGMLLLALWRGRCRSRCWAIWSGETDLPISISALTFSGTAVAALLIAGFTEAPNLTSIAAGWVQIVYVGHLLDRDRFHAAGDRPALRTLGQFRDHPLSRKPLRGSRRRDPAAGATAAPGLCRGGADLHRDCGWSKPRPPRRRAQPLRVAVDEGDIPANEDEGAGASRRVPCRV